jgi:WD40 repeat protein
MGFVAFSAEGTRVASDGPSTPDDLSGALTLWTFPEGRFIRKLPLRPTVISKDWEYAAGYHGITNIATGEALISLPESEYRTCTFSPDSRFVAESSAHDQGHGAQIQVLELPDKKQIASFGAHHSFAMAYSPDGKVLASGHWDPVALWNPLTGERLAALRGFGRYIVALACSPDGRFLITPSTGGLIKWPYDRGGTIRVFQVDDR